MTATDAPEPGGPTRLLNPRRSAHATIRGYLYQTCLGVLRWLNLQSNEILLCEGDEDLDRFLLGGESVSEQVKAYTGGLSLSDRAVVESLGNFLRSYVALRRRGETRRFVFTTTAQQKRTRSVGLNFDLLESWKEGTRNNKVVNAVRSRLKPKKNKTAPKETTEAIAWLDAEPEGWKGFMDAVDWSFDAPDLDVVRDRIKSRLALRDDTKRLSAQIFTDRLIARVLTASIQPQPQDRMLTPKLLSDLIETEERDLGNWGKTPPGERIRTVFDEMKEIHNLLLDNTATISETASPGQLLTAAYEVIPFNEAGRREELDVLKDWCDHKDRRSVLLLTGEGGSGKTRLMIEWCRHLRHQGWHAGFLGKSSKAENITPLLEGVAPRLIVIDYAETRLSVVEALLSKMGEAAEGEGPELRLILLARRQEDWWKNLSLLGREVQDLLLRSPEPRTITPLVPKDRAARQKAFQAAIDGFSFQLGPRPTSDLHVPDLSRVEFEHALYLHMAALVAWHGKQVETAESALKQILAHEKFFWHKGVSDLGLDRSLTSLMNKAVESAVAAVTLIGGAKTVQHAQSLLGRVLKDLPLQPHHPGTVLELIRDLYASPGEEDGRYIEPLQPDILGEELVAEALNQDNQLLGRILDGANSEESYSTLTTLTRIAQRRPEHEEWIRAAFSSKLTELAEIALDVAVDTGDPIGLILSETLEREAPAATILRILELCEDDRYDQCVHLQEVAAIATAHYLESIQQEEDSENEANSGQRAWLNRRLGNRLAKIGRLEEAFEKINAGISIYRELDRIYPDDFRAGLASALVSAANVLNDLQRPEDAWKATAEAIEIYRGFAEDGDTASLSRLAASLDTLGIALAKLGQFESALDKTREAVTLYRTLAQEDPDQFLAVQATALSNLSLVLNSLGHRQEAFTAANESVDIARACVAKRPEAFLPSLARSLNNLSIMHHANGRKEDALQTSIESTQIRRIISYRRPAAFLPGLALSLSGLSIRLREMGRYQEAVAALMEVLSIYSHLSSTNSQDYALERGICLTNLGITLRTGGLSKEALHCASEAVAINRTLVEIRPDASLPHLAASLNNLAIINGDLGNFRIGSEHLEQAVEILRQLSAERSSTFLPELASNLGNLGYMLHMLGQTDKSFLSYLEGIQILTPFFLDLPIIFGPRMEKLVRELSETGEHASKKSYQRALEPIVEILRPFLPDQIKQADGADL